MERLRIEFGGERLDPLRVDPQPPRAEDLPDGEVLEISRCHLMSSCVSGRAIREAVAHAPPPLRYQVMSHRVAAEAALLYSNVVFAGNGLVWLMNALASVIRGTGNMLVPSLATCIGVALLYRSRRC